MKDTQIWLERFKGSALHPLVLPMIFAEHERGRLLNAVDTKSTELEVRILELENRVKKPTKEEEHEQDKGLRRQTMTQRDCEAIRLWREMSFLKDGLEGLLVELRSLRDHLQTLPKSRPQHDSDSGSRQEMAQGPEVYIDARLKEMIAELGSKIRSCEGDLGSMTLATQMVWTFSYPPNPVA